MYACWRCVGVFVPLVLKMSFFFWVSGSRDKKKKKSRIQHLRQTSLTLNGWLQRMERNSKSDPSGGEKSVRACLRGVKRSPDTDWSVKCVSIPHLEESWESRASSGMASVPCSTSSSCRSAPPLTDASPG